MKVVPAPVLCLPDSPSALDALSDDEKAEVRSMGITPWPSADLASGKGQDFVLTAKGKQYFAFAQRQFSSLTQLAEPETLKAWKYAAALSGAEVRMPVYQALESQLGDGTLAPQYRDYARATLYGTWAQRRKSIRFLVRTLKSGANVIALSFFGAQRQNKAPHV